MFRTRPRKPPTTDPQRPAPNSSYLPPERIAAYLESTHAATSADAVVEFTLELLQEHGGSAHTILTSQVIGGQLKITPGLVSASWGSLFGNISRHLTPQGLKLLTKKSMHGSADGQRLTQALIATRDVRIFDAHGLAMLLGQAQRNPPQGAVMAIPIPKGTNDTHHLLVYLPRGKRLVELALAPLIRAVMQHARNVASDTGAGVSRQWILTTPHSILATSTEIRRRRPDLALEPGTRVERTFPTARAELEQLENSLLLEPKTDTFTLDLNAIARGRSGAHDVTLALEFTPIRADASRYVFLGKPSSMEGETLQELGDSAILHTTMQQVGMFLTLDRFGSIHSATESLIDNLGYDPLAVKDLNITSLLDDASITRFERIRDNTLQLVNQPGGHSRVNNAERITVTLQARDGTQREFDMNLMLLRSRVDGEAIPRGFVAVIHLTSSQALLQKELTERLRFVRHDRHSSANAIAALVDEIRRAPNLTRADLDQRLIDIHDEARVWSEITDTHAQLLDAITTLNAPKGSEQEQLLNLSEIVLDQAPRYTRFYARHKLRRADRERVRVGVDEQLKGAMVWARDAGRLTLYYALRNLVENAVKYATPESNGERHITVSVRLDPEQPDHARLEVTNAAAGIQEEPLAEAWEYKRRLGNTANDVTGSGIGLWSTKLLMERTGGHVGAVLHDDDKRVTFYVSFPLIAFNNAAGARTIVREVKAGRLQPVHPEDVRTLVRYSTQPSGIPPKVLVLDADPDDLNMSVHYFRRVSAEVTATQSAAEALAAISRDEFDLVLAEYEPKEQEALENLLRTARRRGATARILTGIPSAVPTSTLSVSSAPTAIYKDGLTPITAVNLAYGRRESHSLPAAL